MDSISSTLLFYQISRVFTVLSAIICIVYVIYCLREDKNKSIKLLVVGLVLQLTAATVSIALFFTSSVSAEQLKTELEDSYKIEFVSKLKPSKLSEINDSGYSESLIVKSSNDDKRAYEVYISKDAEFYTKNEKGVYLPVTKMSENEMNG